MTQYKPETQEQLVACVRQALADGVPLSVVGHGTRYHFTARTPYEERAANAGPEGGCHDLDTTALSGIIAYEPSEMVVTVRAGTSLAQINEALAASSQELAFEPTDYGPLFGLRAARGTIGGALAANSSGPRRIKVGAARDHFLGLHGVSGRGEAFTAGGKVVKNVTGYDLCKGIAGSWGTLAILSEVSVKTMPRAMAQTSLLLMGQDTGPAVDTMSAALGSSADLSAAAYIPAPCAAACLYGADTAITALRLEGVAASVVERVTFLREQFDKCCAVRLIEGDESAAFWRYVRDGAPFHNSDAPLWRLSVPPAEAPALIDTLAPARAVRYMLDWGGGLIWLEVADRALGDGGAALVRGSLAAASSGYARLVRCNRSLGGRVSIFQPQPPALAQLGERLRAGFDPQKILNRGRMTAVL